MIGARRLRFTVAAALLMVLLAGCAPRLQPVGPFTQPAPRLEASYMVTADGLRLPVRSWPAQGRGEGRETAIIVAVHGFGDYSNNFALPGPWWAERGITTYAYDQRGFGATPYFGIWPGTARLTADLRDFVGLVRRRHPGRPLYVVGVSMGAAVALAAAAGAGTEFADGVVLVAPAARGRATMNPVMRGMLWLAAHTMPWNNADGRGLGIRASDNIPVLKAMSRDPLTYKRARIDVIYGLVNMMDAGFAAAPRQSVPILVLYGARDEVIPAGPVEMLVSRLSSSYRLVLYPEGWHLLLRDLQAETVWRDIAAWVANPAAPLPSGLERRERPLFAGR